VTVPAGAGAEAVIAFLRTTDAELPADVSPMTSLLRSGLLDSLALFHLFEWVELQLGCPVDVLSLDLVRDWDTPKDVADYVARGETC